MIQIHRFSELRPGDVLYAKDDIPRQIGSISWYCGIFCELGSQIIVSHVYPCAIRVIHSEGGIHFICSSRDLRRIRLLHHGSAPSNEVARYNKGDRGFGTWPNYIGTYRLIPYAPPRRVIGSRSPKPLTKRGLAAKLKPKTTFALNAKTKTAGRDRQPTKTKSKKTK